LFDSKINQKVEVVLKDTLQITDPYGSLSIKEEAE
jgi:hypothetical protein